MLCPSCGQENREETTFCDGCGSPLARVCPSCQAQLRASARFCNSCGQAVSEPSATAQRTPTPQPSPALPASFASGRYQVKRFLGEGARKRVYLAHDTKLDSDVAIAVIKTEGVDSDSLTRIRREAQAMGRLRDHPHIVTVHDMGDDGGQPYIVIEYMAGGDLEGLLQVAENHRLPLQQALRIADQVCQALEHAHGRVIIHRDLKPGNIWLTEDPSAGSGQAQTAKLGDFGLAIALDRSRLTAAGMMVGTAIYMPPEQALGREADARSDLYSLGCILYEMVTGRPPFLGDDAVAIISQHINTAPVAPSWHNSDVPRALEALILGLLAKAPEDRPESAAAVREALNAIPSAAATVAERIVQEEANPLDRLAGGVFVGRQREMDQLQAGLEDAFSGRGRLLMLMGEPGIGKTRTAEQLATYARLRDAQVLWGRCHAGEGAPPYWPWVQIIRSYVHDHDAEALATEMGPGAADIAQVVSEVRERLPDLPIAPAADPEQARFRLFDSISTFLRNAGNRQPLVLILDDLHWADKPSLLLLQFLARELRDARLLILGSYRDVEVTREHPLTQTLGELTAGQRLSLGGLTKEDTARFIEITAGFSPPEALVEAVYGETEGNPFFMSEVVRLLVSDGSLERPEVVESWSVTIPQGVRQVVGRRLDRLSEECNQVLTIASVIGREFGLDALERVSDLSGDRLLETVEEAVAGHIVAELPGTVGRYSFSHALIRETLYDELSATRSVRLHRRIAEELEGMYGAKPEPHLAELAYHFLEAAKGGGDVDKAVGYAGRAGARATGLLAYEEAVTHYEHALQALELKEAADGAQRCELLLARGDAQWRSGAGPRARETFQQAAAIARELGLSEHLARAALGLGNAPEIGIADRLAIDLIEEALEALGQSASPLRVRLLGSLTTNLYFSNSRERIGPLARQAVETARRVGDPVALGQALTDNHYSLWGPGNTEDRLAMANELLRLAEETGNLALTEAARRCRIGDLLEMGDMQAVDAELDVYTRVAEEMRQPRYVWVSAMFRAMRALFDGRFEEGERLAHEALALGQRAKAVDALQSFGIQIALVRREQSRLKEIEPAIKGLVARYPAMPAWRSGLAWLYSELGREEARTEFERLAANGFANLPQDWLWLTAITFLSEVCAFLSDVSRAERLYELLLPHEGRCVVVGMGAVSFGTASRPLGLLATTMCRWEEAEHHFQNALEMNARMGARAWVAHTQHGYASMLLARDQPGDPSTSSGQDRERAVKLLTEALDTAQELGMKTLTERALALKMQAQGIDYGNITSSIDAVASAVTIEQPDLRSHAAPDGTVTILFTDIEGSTAMTERLGDRRWLEVLHAHNAIVRGQVVSHEGFEVKSRGDGFMLAFESAHRALHCAIGIQRDLAEHNEAAEDLIRVRIGLHTGEVIQDAGDFYGKNVNLAARIAEEAQGGEVLVSSLVKELTEAAGDIVFGQEQEVELKGLSGRHRVFGVAW